MNERQIEELKGHLKQYLFSHLGSGDADKAYLNDALASLLHRFIDYAIERGYGSAYDQHELVDKFIAEFYQQEDK